MAPNADSHRTGQAAEEEPGGHGNGRGPGFGASPGEGEGKAPAGVPREVEETEVAQEIRRRIQLREANQVNINKMGLLARQSYDCDL